MPKRSDRLLLEDIVESISKISNYTLGLSFNDFTKDERTFDAVIRNLTVIGEAANRSSSDFTLRFDEVEWYKVVAFRNRLVNEYFGVDYEAVWMVITNYLTTLEKYINRILIQHPELK